VCQGAVLRGLFERARLGSVSPTRMAVMGKRRRHDIRTLTTGPLPTYSPPDFSARTIHSVRPFLSHYTATYFRHSCYFCQYPFGVSRDVM
jgi:hypothetical protein